MAFLILINQLKNNFLLFNIQEVNKVYEDIINADGR